MKSDLCMPHSVKGPAPSQRSVMQQRPVRVESEISPARTLPTTRSLKLSSTTFLPKGVRWRFERGFNYPFYGLFENGMANLILGPSFPRCRSG